MPESTPASGPYYSSYNLASRPESPSASSETSDTEGILRVPTPPYTGAPELDLLLQGNHDAITIVRHNPVFRQLWDRIWRSDRYRKYRSNPKQKPNKDESRWLSEREEAFWMAIARDPPRGRKQEPYRRGAKPQGRNQSIAQTMNEFFSLYGTSEAYTRKHVSSHIQVVKKLLRDDPLVYEYLQGDHTLKQSRSTPSVGKITRNRVPNGCHERDQYCRGDFVLRDARNNFPVNQLSLPRGPTLFSQDFSTFHVPLEYLHFRMYSRDSTCALDNRPGHVCGSSSTCQFEYLHVFTESKGGTGMPDTRIWDAGIEAKFPELGQMNCRKIEQCPIIYAEASLAIPTQQLRTDANVQLLIEGTIATGQYWDSDNRWICRTTFYDDRIRKKVVEQEINSINDDCSDGVFRHSLPFASRYWAERLVELTSMQRCVAKLEREGEAKSARHSPANCSDALERAKKSKKAKELHNQISGKIKSISARQEILAYPKFGGQDELPTTHFMILWKFRQTRPSEAGTTQFRNLLCRQSTLSIDNKGHSSPQDEKEANTTAGMFADEQRLPASSPASIRQVHLLSPTATFDAYNHGDYGVSAICAGTAFDVDPRDSAEHMSMSPEMPNDLQNVGRAACSEYNAALADQSIVVGGLDENHGIEAPIPESRSHLFAFVRGINSMQDIHDHRQEEPQPRQDFAVYNMFNTVEQSRSYPEATMQSMPSAASTSLHKKSHQLHFDPYDTQSQTESQPFQFQTYEPLTSQYDYGSSIEDNPLHQHQQRRIDAPFQANGHHFCHDADADMRLSRAALQDTNVSLVHDYTYATTANGQQRVDSGQNPKQ